MDPNQLVINTIVFGSVIGIAALGVNLVYGLLRFANFVHVEFLTVGAYLGYEIHRSGLPLMAAGALSALSTAVLAMAVYLLVFRRLETQTASAKMIASVGVAIFLRAAIRFVFGTRALEFPDVPTGLVSLGGIRLSAMQTITLAITLAAMIVLHLLLRKTRIGTALRATSENRALASTRGVDTGAITYLVWGIAGAFAAIAGILIGMQGQVRPSMGLSLLLPVFAAATVGGLGSAYGAVAGGFLIALVQNVALAIPVAGTMLPVEYKDVAVLLVLIAILLLRPAGLVRSPTD